MSKQFDARTDFQKLNSVSSKIMECLTKIRHEKADLNLMIGNRSIFTKWFLWNKSSKHQRDMH